MNNLKNKSVIYLKISTKKNKNPINLSEVVNDYQNNREIK
jgi:hypothetical protein